jgi:hypothetical protein
MDNYKILILVIAVLLIVALVYLSRNNTEESFKNFPSISEMKALDEWNKNAASYLCSSDTDASEIRDDSTMVTFCKRMISDKEYSKFSKVLINDPADYRRRNLINSDQLHYGETESSGFVKQANTDAPGNDIGYYRLNPNACEKMALNNEKAASFVTDRNGTQCWIKDKIPKKTKNSQRVLYTRGGAKQFTYSCWLRINKLDPSWCHIFQRGSDGKRKRLPGLWVRPNSTGLHLRLSQSNNWNDGIDVDTGKIPYKKLFHFAFTLNDKDLKVYVNGDLTETHKLGGSFTAPDDTDHLVFNRLISRQKTMVDLWKLRLIPVAVPQHFIENVLLKEKPDSNQSFESCLNYYINRYGAKTENSQRYYSRICENKIMDTQDDLGKGMVRNLQYAHDSYRPVNLDASRHISYQIINGIVYLSGLVQNVKGTGTIALLPKEIRPSKRLIFTQGNRNNEKSARIDILPSGHIHVQVAADNTEYSLDGWAYPLSPGENISFTMPQMAHFVKLSNSGSHCLHVAEVEVFDENNKLISREKPTSQSSDYNTTGTSDKAVDGNKSGNWSDKSVTHTQCKSNQWLMINLGGPRRVKKVVVYNRTDCCTERIAGTKVSLLDRDEKEILYQIWDPNDYSSTHSLTTTLSGKTCQNWTQQYPHRHGHWKIPRQIVGRSGAIIDKYSIYMNNGVRMSSSGRSGGGGGFNYDCGSSGIAYFGYNPGGWGGRFSNWGGIGPVKCNDGRYYSGHRGKRRSRWADYRGRERNYRKKGLGNHNFCRKPSGGKGLWCYTNDPRTRWEYCGVNGIMARNTNDKIYARSKEFIFNMSTSVPTGWGNYQHGYHPATVTSSGGQVVINGLVKFKRDKLVNELVIGSVPTKYAPSIRKVFNVSAHDFNARVDILPDGTILFVTCNERAGIKTRGWKWVCLDGITYNAQGWTHVEFPLGPGFKAMTNGGDEANNGLVKHHSAFKSTDPYKPSQLSFSATVTGNQTIAFWVKANQNGRQNPIDFGYGGEGTITIEPSGSVSYYYGTRGGYGSPYQYHGTTSNAIKWNTWTHLAITRDFQNKKLIWYVNGKKNRETATKFTYAAKSGFKKIGNGYVNPLNGELKDIRIYNRAVPESVIANLASANTGVVVRYNPPSVTKSGRVVSLQGLLTMTQPGKREIGNIPEEFRPNRNLEFWVNQNNKSCLVIITQHGSIQAHFVDEGQGFISLDGISYTTNKSF